jgi:hypothetical protein
MCWVIYYLILCVRFRVFYHSECVRPINLVTCWSTVVWYSSASFSFIQSAILRSLLEEGGVILVLRIYGA